MKVERHSAKLHWSTSLCVLRNWLAAETFSDPILKTMSPLELEADDPKLEDVAGELVVRRDSSDMPPLVGFRDILDGTSSFRTRDVFLETRPLAVCIAFLGGWRPEPPILALSGKQGRPGIGESVAESA